MVMDLATPTELGALNLRRLAEAIIASGPISRAQLSRQTGLSKPTVSLALARLESADLVREVGRTQGDRGATALLYALSPTAGNSLALDVGRRLVRTRVTDLSGRVLSATSTPTAGTSAARLATQVSDLAWDAVHEAGGASVRLVSVTLGVPGVPTPGGERVRLSPRLPGLQHASVVSRLRERLGVEVRVENDVNLAARAELDLGHGREHPDFVLLAVGTGVGLALVLEGRLRPGAHHSAGEIGYLPVLDPRAQISRASSKPGAFESAVDAQAIVRAARTGGLRVRSAEDVAQLARAHDKVALQVFRDQADLLAMGVASVCAIVDPGLVVLGGGLGIGAADVVLPLLGRAVRRLTPFRPTIVVSALADHAVLDGAAVDALHTARDVALGDVTGHYRHRTPQEQP